MEGGDLLRRGNLVRQATVLPEVFFQRGPHILHGAIKSNRLTDARGTQIVG